MNTFLICLLAICIYVFSEEVSIHLHSHLVVVGGILFLELLGFFGDWDLWVLYLYWILANYMICGMQYFLLISSVFYHFGCASFALKTLANLMWFYIYFYYLCQKSQVTEDTSETNMLDIFTYAFLNGLFEFWSNLRAEWTFVYDAE